MIVHVNDNLWAFSESVKDFKIDPEIYPYVDKVPIDPVANMEYRINLLESAKDDIGLQQQLCEMCREDTLFFINTFCWLYEPRPRPKILPFILWPHQFPALATMERCLGYEDLGLEKSRGEGATWMYLTLFFKYWLFEDLVAFGLVTRNEETVDSKEDTDTLMWKIDFHMRNLPFWMRPEGFEQKLHRSYSKHSLVNPANGSTIVGYSATGDVASGGRKTAFAMDEMAKFPVNCDYDALKSTQYVTDCRFIVSTYKGNSGAYYDSMTISSSMTKIILDWKDNPLRNKGLYRIENNKMTAVDPVNNPLTPGYEEKSVALIQNLRDRGYQIGDKDRSQWYDNECSRATATPASIAEELDRDPTRSGSPFFDPEMIDKLRKECCDPFHIGEIEFAKTDYAPSFHPEKNGNWQLWCKLLPTGKPPNDRDYSIGIDVAAGIGGVLSSNSAFSVVDRKTRTKVAEYTNPNINPFELAELAFSAAKFFKGPRGPAFIIHEANGIGAQFTKKIEELGHPNLFLREDEFQTLRKKTRRHGFWNQGDARSYLYGYYQENLITKGFINLSRAALSECMFYVNTSGGGIDHVAAIGKNTDPSGAGHNHGDRATADALACRSLKDFPIQVSEVPEEIAQPGSFGYRRKSRNDLLKKDEYW